MSITPSDEYTTLRGEVAQRTSFQHTYSTVNLIAAGTLLSFSLSQRQSTAVGVLANDSILLIPAVSFMLFCVWLHHAFSIIEIGTYLEDQLDDRWEKSHAFSTWTGLLLAIPQVINFLGAPILALALYSEQTNSVKSADLIRLIDGTLVVLTGFGFLVWAIRVVRLKWVSERFPWLRRRFGWLNAGLTWIRRRI